MLEKKRNLPPSLPPSQSLWATFFKKNWLLFTLTLLLLFGIQGSWVAGAYFFSKIIDLVAQEQHWKKMIGMFVGLAVSWLMYPVLTAAKDAIDIALLPRLISNTRTEILDRIFQAFHRYITLDPQTMGIENIVRTPAVMRHMFEQLRDTLLPLLICLVITLVFFFTMNKTLGSVYLLGIGMFSACVLLLLFCSVDQSKKIETTQSHITEHVADILTNIGTVVGNNNIAQEQQGLCVHEKTSVQEQGAVQGFATLTRAAFTTLYLMMFAGLFIIAIALNQKRVNGVPLLSTGVLTTITFVLTYMITYFEDMSHQLTHLAKNFGQLAKTQLYLDQLYLLSQTFPDGTRTILPQNGHIEILDLCMRYSQHLPPILDHFALSVPAGQCLLLRGENGSGKSTLIKILSGKLPFQTGTILFGGVDLVHTRADVLHQAIVYLPQTPQLLNRSVYENIAYGTNVDRPFVQKLLDDFHITFAALDSPVGKNGSFFSGGQRQILCLLRIFCHPQTLLLLLDEPTAALDPATRDKAMELLSKIIVNRTTIVITHDEQLTAYANRKIVLDHGKIVTDELVNA